MDANSDESDATRRSDEPSTADRTRMRAVVMRTFGPPDVLRPEVVDRPTPGDDEVLIATRATTVTAGDCEFRRMDLPVSLQVPIRLYTAVRRRDGTILGQELAGEVESVGAGVERFEPGDRVVAATQLRFGAYAEYACLPQTYPIATIPDGVTYDEAATIPVGGVNGRHFLRKGDVRAGETVLVIGAGGSIGTYAVQIAKSLGADVTAVDSAGKLDALRSIGADRVVDYAVEDVTDSEESYDAIVDVIGGTASSRALARLNVGGRYVLGNPTIAGRLRGLWTTLTTDETVAFELASARSDDLRTLLELVDSGEVRPVIDRRYALSEVADAHRYVETGRKMGNVVVTVG